jgi:hypothetical protein
MFTATMDEVRRTRGRGLHLGRRAVPIAAILLALAPACALDGEDADVEPSDAELFEPGSGEAALLDESSPPALEGEASSDDVAISSWLGLCYPVRGNTHAGGWCDGNGPNWTYRGIVRCSNNQRYLGVERWAGDRRGSHLECPANTFTLSVSGLEARYNGVHFGYFYP